MNHIAAAEERIVSERLRRKLNDVNVAAQTHLSGITDYVNFTLQQTYFKCAHECFDRRRSQEEINHCVENCSIPVVNANNLVEMEMAKFQERLQRSLMVCQDKYEAAKLHPDKSLAMGGLESCVDLAIQEGIQTLPYVVDKLKNTLSIDK
ncbi:hypothetical protein GIB67_024072 [Kingdonia uniflora]|uniref:Protein FAM136A n=1 Tax=Kingdonia uniflora TaxID=39325 RepID=A0A7J7MMV4_9MAGN|nr:hypothetical protein GIB67_024072 [Kingdonia uniflora]